MNILLFDTNIIISIINTHNLYHDIVVKYFKEIIITEYKIYISSITYYEFMYGIEKSKIKQLNYNSLHNFLSKTNIKILPFTEDHAKIAGKIRARLELKGNMIGSYDVLIASQAIYYDYLLITNNFKEFNRIEELQFKSWLG